MPEGMVIHRIDRLTRVKMLLASYVDACPGLLSQANDRVSTGKPGSSIPHLGELWPRGSYQALEGGLEELSLVSRQRLWRAFMWQPDRRRRGEQLAFRHLKRKEIRHDLDALSDVMPRDIHVPKDIIENWNDYVAPPKKTGTDAVP